MSENRFKISAEKIEFLVKSSLEENDFTVFSVESSFDTFTPQTTGREQPVTIIEEYDLYLVVDYMGAIDSYEPHSFASDIMKMCELLRHCVTQFTVTRDGKIVRGDENVYASDAFILNIDFKYEELHKFAVTFKFTYPD